MRGTTQDLSDADLIIENGRVIKDRSTSQVRIVVDGILVRDWTGPVETERDTIIDAVRADLLRRSQLGIKKYGKTLSSYTDGPMREKLQHAYEEALDLANYLKWAITQIDTSDDIHAISARQCAEHNARLKQGVRDVVAGLPVPDGSLAEKLNRIIADV